MTVFVVMGNDYPASVFDNEEAANEYCYQRRLEFREGYAKIYWRIYDFDLLSVCAA